MSSMGPLSDKLGSPRTQTFYTKAEHSEGLSPSGEGGLEPTPPRSERLEREVPIHGLCALT
jgi:hypothetical protein